MPRQSCSTLTRDQNPQRRARTRLLAVQAQREVCARARHKLAAQPPRGLHQRHLVRRGALRGQNPCQALCTRQGMRPPSTSTTSSSEGPCGVKNPVRPYAPGSACGRPPSPLRARGPAKGAGLGVGRSMPRSCRCSRAPSGSDVALLRHRRPALAPLADIYHCQQTIISRYFGYLICTGSHCCTCTSYNNLLSHMILAFSTTSAGRQGPSQRPVMVRGV